MKLYFVLTLCAIGANSGVFHEDENDKLLQLFLLQGDQEADLPEVTFKATVTDVTYFLYSTNSIDDPHIVLETPQDLAGSPHFDPKKRIIFIIHGWVDDFTADVNTLIKAAVLKHLDVNIIVVDWSPIAKKDYFQAQSAVIDIGLFVGEFINNIMNAYRISGSQIILIGHSLGAHIAGNAGAVTKTKVAHIIGLDPAGPFFTVGNKENRLDSTDADYVSVVHTNGRLLGFPTSIGHLDFYPNGGMVQSGCGPDLLGVCSHARSFQYLAEAIGGGIFTATYCSNYSMYLENLCDKHEKTLFGDVIVNKRVVGDFFFETNGNEPYARG